MTRPVFNWPDESGEAVRAAKGRLELAGERLAKRSFEQRLASVASVVEAWSSTDSPWRRELTKQLANATPFHPNTLEEGLESALRAWHPEQFIACARREIAGGAESGQSELAPFACTSVLAGGSIPMPTLLAGLLPLVLGSPVLLRETTKDPVTGSLLVRSIADCDAELAECLEVVRFQVEDEAAMNVLLSSPCFVATGSDATLAGIAARLGPGQRFVGYGHRFSIAVIGPHVIDSENELEPLARGLALDVARWDQSGCLSPVVVYLVGVSAEARSRLAARVAAALEELSTSLPRGEISSETLALHASERAEARMRSAVEATTEVHEGRDFTVILEADALPRPAPLARFLRLVAVDSPAALARELAVFVPHLSTAAIGGFEAAEAGVIRGVLTKLGVSRICAPGRLQTPPIDWPHDGMPVFTPMARFVQAERR